VNAALAGILGAIVALAVSRGHATPYDNYVLFAYALLHGQVWIDATWPGPAIDAVLWHGHRYIVNDPIPGLLMLPLVAVFGLAANETLVACLMCGIAIGAAWHLLERLGLTTVKSIWMVAFLLAGTDLLWCSMLGDVWFFAQTCAVAFTLLAMCELAGKRRGWLVGLWTGLALGSRFTLVMALPVLFWWCWNGFLAPERRPRAARAFALTLVPFFLAWIGYNEVRWGVPWDSGHTIFFHQDPFMGAPTGSPFGLANVPVELWSFLIQPPIWHADGHWVEFALSGTALWFTSPALVLALFARRPRALVVSLWVATLLVAAPSLLYYANGGSQFGMRHALDFEPFLVLLMALGVRDQTGAPWRIGQAAIVWSVAVGLWGCWYWDVMRAKLGVY